MPLTPEYTWMESDSTIVVEVPLRGQPKSKVDVFATEWYLKISLPPYLLELDLERCIDPSQNRARIENGTLVMKATKKEGHCGLWGTLGQIVHRKCDSEVKRRREESIQEQLKREKELGERVSLRKHEDERLALRSQMNIEEAERRRIEETKADEKNKAEAEVYQALAEMTARQQRRQLAPSEQDDTPAAQPKENDDEKQDGRSPCHQREHVEEERKPSRSPDRIGRGGGTDKERSEEPTEVRAADSDTFLDRSIWDGPSNKGDIDNNHDDRDENGETGRTVPKLDASPLSIASFVETQAIYAEDEGLATYVPAPRASTGVVPVGFTPRIFPTPLRESKMADESAWIMKNRRHLHRNKALVGRFPKSPEPGDQPFDISESDPVWLKSRGDDLYRGGDFLAAVNAYTSALDADPKAFACLSNRAACHLRLGKHSECTADCGAALGILQTLPETGLIQARVLARRALAQRELGHYRLSLEDFRAALDFHPGDPALLQEIKRAEPLAQCETAKKEAVKRFASGDVEGACKLYTAALAAVPASPSCLSNRAACHLALRRPQDCIRDCDTVLELLSADPSCSYHAENNRSGDALVQKTPKPPRGLVPKAGSDKRRQWVLTTLLRRGRASVELGHLENALKDYRDASSLAPEDRAVERDVRELERQVDETMSSRH